MSTEDYVNTKYPIEEPDNEEDYPGQKRERERQRIIEQAVSAADTIILDGSNGSVEETDYLTGQVAEKFLYKVCCRLTAQLLKHDLDKRRS